MTNSNWNRRNVLKSLGLAAVGAPLTSSALSKEQQNHLIPINKFNDKELNKPVKVIVIGAGSRGWGAYSSYGLKFPKELQVVGVAEPILYRRERISKAYNIPKENQFVTWEHVFNKPKFNTLIFP